MSWPSFDLGETINQAITGIVTLVGVLVGGSIAFRYGLRQLRQEKAIERRLVFFESLLEKFDEFVRDMEDAVAIFLRSVRYSDASLTELGSEYAAKTQSLDEQLKRIYELFVRTHHLIDLTPFNVPELIGVQGALATAIGRVVNAKEDAERLKLIEENVLAVHEALLRTREAVRKELGLPSLEQLQHRGANEP